jgi:hypothetical protein
MKKVKYLYTLTFVALIFLGSACTKDFIEINTNPNLPVSVPLANHLAGAMISFDGANLVISDGAITINTRYVGSMSVYDPNASNTYQNTTSSDWSNYYANLVDINDIIAKATEAKAYNMVAAALTYRAEMTQIATDRWGEMPYSEAGKAADGIFRPKYDDQPSIYKEIIKDLKTAADYFKAGNTDKIGTVEPFYKGDVKKWQKFCNSLRLRVAIRISNVDEAGAKAIISEVLGNSGDYPITQGIDDRAEITYGGTGSGWEVDYWYWMNLLLHSGPTEYIINMLKNYNDPRLERICSPAPGPLASGIIEYRGGTEIGRSPDFTVPQMSYFNKNYYVVNGTTGPNIHLRHSEVCFNKAEFFLRGLYTGGDAAAKIAYEDGIKASMKELSIMADGTPQITDAVIATYLSNPLTAWAGTTQEKLVKIWNQKWIAMCFMENEPWAEMRRTDVPNFGIARGSYYSGHNRGPFRLPYPAEEERMNSVNSKTYFERQKAGDYLWGGQLWWDKRTGVK